MSFLPFTRPHIDENTIAAVVEVLRSGWITTGPKCRELEAALSQRYGGRPVRVANSATAALELALRVADIGPDDEVLVPSLTWVATANVVLAVGATPRFIDVAADTRLIDLALVENAITSRTRAIMPVDLAGLPVDRDRLYALATKHGLRVIEDAAQSQGANWHGQEIGSFGDLVCFSFHPNKNMTTGEGGCLVMNTDEEAVLFEKLRFQGITRRADHTYDCDVLGGKSNLTDIAAAIGLGQLKQLDAFNAKRKVLAKAYFECLDPNRLELPLADFEHGNWQMFQVLLPEAMADSRAELIDRMKADGIGIGVHFPAVHLTSLYQERGYGRLCLPHTESIARRTMSLPLFPQMEIAQVERVAQNLHRHLDEIKSQL
jgi:dTDP-4-amino-4,6-dideoxygalactose transaminase